MEKQVNGSSEYEYEYYEYYVDENPKTDKKTEKSKEIAAKDVIPDNSKKRLPKDPEVTILLFYAFFSCKLLEDWCILVVWFCSAASTNLFCS